jgi:flagellar motor switch protein FliG
LSRLVDFEDLRLLDGNDLRAVIQQVAPEVLQAALAALTPANRRIILASLPLALAARIESEVQAVEAVDPEASHLAQREVVDTLCRLGRCGLVAFDDPYDLYPDTRVA